MKTFIIRHIDSGLLTEVEYKGLATNKGAQILARIGSLKEFYKFEMKKGCGIAKASKWKIINSDLELVRKWVLEDLDRYKKSDLLKGPS
jgi:hypothetical protein